MSENMLKNPGFDSGVPNDWHTWDTGTEHEYIYPDAGRLNGFSVATRYKTRENDKLAAWIQDVIIDSSKKYILSGYIKTENIVGTGASIRIVWKDDDWKYLSTSTIMARQTGTIAWKLFEGVVTPHPNATGATLILDLKDCAGKVWFDDISLVIGSPITVSHPNMFVSSDEIEDIKAKIDQEPWKSAYEKMIKDANIALNVKPPSVTYKGKTPSSGDRHDYYTENPYGGWKNCSCAQHMKKCSEINCCGNAWCDGKINLDQDRTDYEYVLLLGNSVRNLGMAYAFTGDKKYADKVLDFINTWCVNPTTKMNPKFTNDQSRIEISITIPGMFYGADLIWNYPGWNANDKQKFKEWVSDMIKSAKTWSRDNNWEGWRLVLISAASVITEDEDSRNYAFDKWKEAIPIQIGTDGKMVQELHRTLSLFYSVFGMNALTQTTEIARHYNVDLYNYKTPDGRGLELALDYHAPYIALKKPWTAGKQIRPYKGEGATVYELAYKFKQKPSYEDVIKKWGRPMYELRIIGPVTLTHGVAFGSPTPEPEPSPIPGYQLVWRDEFNQNTIGENWFHAGNSDYAYIKDGHLHLKLDVVNGKVKRGYVKSGSSKDNVRRFGPYGFFEIKAKISNKIGVDNQCWLGMEGWGTPTGFEIDIFEYVPRRKQYSMNFLAGENRGKNWKGKNVIINLDTDYHLFQFEWLPDTYIFKLDGKELWRFEDKDPSKKWIADKPGKMSLALCGSYPEPGCSIQGVEEKIDDLKDLPTYFAIDYVRFYQKD